MEGCIASYYLVGDGNHKGDVKVLLLQHIVSDPEIGVVLCSRRRLGHQMITGCRLSIDK